VLLMNQPHQIKEAFIKVKDDINRLNLEVNEIKKEVDSIKNSINRLIEIVNKLNSLIKLKINQGDNSNRQTIQQTDNPAQDIENTPIQHKIPTDLTIPTHSSTDNIPFKGLKDQNYEISIGNKGVPTDRQTDQQTDNPTHSSTDNLTQNPLKLSQIPIQNNTHSILNPSLVLSQLDSIKKEIRLKIKRLTNQEMLIFSSIYQFEDQGETIDYSFLSSKLKLSESSIRDYTQRIITKGLPLVKQKINNKRIILHISPDLKKLASLNTLINLRNL